MGWSSNALRGAALCGRATVASAETQMPLWYTHANTCLYEIYSCIEIQVCYNVMNILVLRHPWFFELDILVSTAALLSPKSDGRKTVDERSGTSSDQCSKPSVLPFYCTGWWIGFPIQVLSFNPFFASVKSQQKCRLNPTSEVSELPLLNRLHQKGYSTPASRLPWNVVDSADMQLTFLLFWDGGRL